jgi:hypothetical protein
MESMGKETNTLPSQSHKGMVTAEADFGLGCLLPSRQQLLAENNNVTIAQSQCTAAKSDSDCAIAISLQMLPRSKIALCL